MTADRNSVAEDDHYDLLRTAVMAGDYKNVAVLCAQGVDINATDYKGETVLHLAMRISSAVDVMQLLDLGADPNKASDEGVTPLMAAINATKFANAEFAIDFKGDINYQPTPQSPPPLFLAMTYDTINGSTERTAFLLKRGVNVDMAVVLDDGRVITMIDRAHASDLEGGRTQFSGLFKTYLDRDIRAEFEAAAANKSSRARNMAVITARSKNSNQRFKLVKS